MKFVKKHKGAILGLSVLIAVVVACLILKDVVMFDETEAVYGNRLDGIEEVKVTSKQKSAVSDSLKDVSEKVTVRVSGRVVNVIIEANPETDLGSAKAMGDTALGAFTDEQKQYFDFQIFIDESENQDQYPILGYKQKSRDGIFWTNDRAKTES